jgi:hypothetical protein
MDKLLLRETGWLVSTLVPLPHGVVDCPGPIGWIEQRAAIAPKATTNSLPPAGSKHSENPTEVPQFLLGLGLSQASLFLILLNHGRNGGPLLVWEVSRSPETTRRGGGGATTIPSLHFCGGAT